MTAAVLWARADWRRRWASVLGLALLVGLAGGFVLTAAAGARRTASSVERLESTTRVADGVIDVGGLDESTIEEISDLPIVATAARVGVVFALVEGVDEDMSIWIPSGDGFGTTIERDRILRGRRTDPRAIDEVVVDERAVELAGVDIGDEVVIATLSPEQVAAEDYFPPRGPVLEFEVVGVARGVDDLVFNAEGAFYASPPLLDEIEQAADVFTTYLGVELVEGATEADLDEAVSEITPESGGISFALEDRARPVREAASALATGLVIFALLAGLAAVTAVGQAIGRHVATAAADERSLAAIGMPRSSRRAALVLAAAPIAIGGAVLAVIIAIAGSSTMPIGVARRAEPDPGIQVDGAVLLIGGGAMLLLVLAAAAITAWWQTRPTTVTASHESKVASAAIRVGAGPAAVTGIRYALDRGRPVLPTRSALVGVIVAVLGTVGVLTFAASLDRLVDEPDRWGYPWDVMLNFTTDSVDAATVELADDDRLATAARWDSGFSFVGGEGVRAFGLTPLRGDPGFALRSGRQPVDEREIVVGPGLADALDLELDDEVEVSPTPSDRGDTVVVVGTALFPEIDEDDLLNSVGYYGDAFGEHAEIAAFFEASQVVVRVDDHEEIDAVIASLAEEFPESLSGESLPVAPGGVGNLAGLRTLPQWLAAFVAVLGLASLVHVLVTTSRRRRQELATLRSLGLTRRQTNRCLVWQAAVIGAVGAVVGVPLGLIAGRAAWWSVADPIGVSPSELRPWLGIALTGAGAIAAGMLVAVLVSAASGRRTLAVALRAE